MSLLGVVVISPLWGIISSQLFLLGWLAFTNLIIHLIGAVKGGIDRKLNIMGMGAAAMKVVLFSTLLYGGAYLLTDKGGFGNSMAEKVGFWICATVSLLYMVPEVPAIVQKAWRNAMVAGPSKTTP